MFEVFLRASCPLFMNCSCHLESSSCEAPCLIYGLLYFELKSQRTPDLCPRQENTVKNVHTQCMETVKRCDAKCTLQDRRLLLTFKLAMKLHFTLDKNSSILQMHII